VAVQAAVVLLTADDTGAFAQYIILHILSNWGFYVTFATQIMNIKIMILELRIKNFLSFKDEVTFSFEATDDKTFEDYQVVEIVPGVRILRLAIVYGANASGKSNLVKTFDFLRQFWVNNPENKNKPTGVTPFLLNRETPQKPSEFSLIFYTEKTKYMYSLELSEKQVFSEELSIYTGAQPTLIFDRKLKDGISEITFNPERIKISQIAKEEVTVKCLSNMSVLAAYNQVNVSIPEIENVVKWIKLRYSLPTIEPSNTSMVVEYVNKAMLKNKFVKYFILNFLQQADYNITGINAETSPENVSEAVVQEILNAFPNMPNEEQERLKREKTITVKRTVFDHNVMNDEGHKEEYKLPINNQSEGTIRTFGLAGVICERMEANAFWAIDEIESSLHPRLVEFIIENFLKQKSQSQLLLTTHYDGLLEEDDLLRKDSIWFTSKKENGSTEMYSLADFNGLDRINSLQKAYKYGKFGAIPNI
jgi:AAA15 family ATPase/GTPase